MRPVENEIDFVALMLIAGGTLVLWPVVMILAILTLGKVERMK